MNEALSSSETWGLTRATRRNISEDAILHLCSSSPSSVLYTKRFASSADLSSPVRLFFTRYVGLQICMKLFGEFNFRARQL
jgi:hypothetical protein